MLTDDPYPRFIQARVTEALQDTPVVVIQGARQCGKTTLARMVAECESRAYFTFDDAVSLEAATADPVGFVSELPERCILDEVQRLPELFTTLKAAVDRHRLAGRFLLTGSTNVLLLPRLADSLAGRMETVRLHPLAQCELSRRTSDFIGALFGGAFGDRGPIRRRSCPV